MRASADLEDSRLVAIHMLETAYPEDALRKSVRPLYISKNTLQSTRVTHTKYMPFEMTETNPKRRVTCLDADNCCEQRFVPKHLSVLTTQPNECIQLCPPKSMQTEQRNMTLRIIPGTAPRK